MKLTPLGTKWIGVDPLTCGGQPVLSGHRLTLAQMLAEIVDMGSVDKVEDAFNLEPGELAMAVRELAEWLQQDFSSPAE